VPATVPTKAEFDALAATVNAQVTAAKTAAAKVTALEARIKTLETAPAPAPAPSLTVYSDTY
jgi:cell division protein FtsB